MSDLNKTERLDIRVSPEQTRRLKRASELESVRRGEAIEPGTLAREIIFAGVDGILSAAGESSLAMSAT